jgi:hypothetical protein
LESNGVNENDPKVIEPFESQEESYSQVEKTQFGAERLKPRQEDENGYNVGNSQSRETLEYNRPSIKSKVNFFEEKSSVERSRLLNFRHHVSNLCLN